MRCLDLIAFSCAYLTSCVPAPAADQQALGHSCSRKSGIADHIPEYLASAAKGPALESERKLDLRVVLQLRNLDELNRTIVDMTTEGAAQFGNAMTPEQFAERHLPTHQEADAAVAALRQAGLTVEDRPVGALLKATGTVAQVNQAFGTTIVAGGDGGYRPDGVVTMPIDVIRGVQGLGDHLPPRQWSEEEAIPQQPPLTPDAIRRAYSVPAELAGKGQTLAIVGLDGFLDSDIDAYAAKHGIRRVPVKRHLINGFDGKPHNPGGQNETTMDLELMSAVAPQAEEIWAVLASQDDPHGLLDGLNVLANPPPKTPRVQHVSVSWGVPEIGTSQASSQVMATVLKQLASQGTTVWVASGDEGAYDAGDGERVVDSPASSPFAGAVGGTRLQLAPTRQETTWVGSGGGYSCFWPAPRWQGRAWGQPSHEVMRAVPDVALAADPGTPYAAIVNGHEMAVGGTSAAAPVMAGLSALLAESRASAGKRPLGFLPPLLYSASCAVSAEGFNDIIVGQNSGDAATGGYDAARGYDAATGLGSVNLGGLIKQLGCL